ncbi:hypothetical protein F1188_18850 [Roseospira marina]|uniref:Glycosyl transferase family 28 C-terminal domain-containing protein n=1 Tax=Roseospira marina TaxID=140057 RepID=A0A5M6I7H4_9PROT|nr:hypothetical protein [Roseospira marina]KAA5603837.1 hypothetical protein F1188_18850 [Roseospira marina]MBB4313775.1 spore coat polysaccharide biosynthesis predicted glycosyltransferase SpsG [Roseospira marina]MBB5086937.1 spore coat polysaccharide biosynthesis predicted glycosyltransferase SpsG [Roseospira marina]
MADPIVLRCDLFPGSGAGHLKRCVVLAHALEAEGFAPRLLIDSESLESALPLDPGVAVEGVPVGPRFDEARDAVAVAARAVALGARVVLVDSYRIGPRWFETVRAAGRIVAALDDLGTAGGAHLTVTYAPGTETGAKSGAAEDADTPIRLVGPAYMITDSPDGRRSDPPVRPRRLIAHAGGTGAFEAARPMFAAIRDVAARHTLDVTWLCPGPAVAESLRRDGLAAPNHAVDLWRRDPGPLWAGYDIVVGPASTSLYEAILQGALPVSFAISDTQTSGRDQWIHLGHTLHMDRAEMASPGRAEAMLERAVTEHAALRAALAAGSRALDAHGATRVARALRALADGRPFNPEHAAAIAAHPSSPARGGWPAGAKP